MRLHLQDGAKRESMNTLSGVQRSSGVCWGLTKSLRTNWKKFLTPEASHSVAPMESLVNKIKVRIMLM